jgi:GNAT superfamily N-acetyltransferase
MTPVSLRIDRVDPLDLDLDLADALAEVFTACERADGLPFQPKTGPELLTSRQRGTDSRPVDAMLVAWDGDRPLAEATVELPWRDNTDSASVRVRVHPDARGRGLGRDLWQRAVGHAREHGRTRVRAGAWQGGPGVAVLDHWGLTRTGVGVIRRIDVHGTPRDTWDRRYDEALGHAHDYELLRQVGSTPADRVDGLVALHDAINDAPSSDPDDEPDAWDAQRLADYEGAMAGRRQTLYRVMARHRATGAWAGQSMLCVNEFSPAEAFQEDTSVVRAHRGHRLGLLMKAAMLRWVVEERPEVGAVDTWNDATNHHMIAINERLGAVVVARHQGFRADV